MFEKFISNVRAILTTRLSICFLIFKHIRSNVQIIFLNCSGIFSLTVKNFCSQLQTIFLKCLTIYVQKNFLHCFDRMLKKFHRMFQRNFFPKVLAMFVKCNNIFSPHDWVLFLERAIMSKESLRSILTVFSVWSKIFFTMFKNFSSIVQTILLVRLNIFSQ